MTRVRLRSATLGFLAVAAAIALVAGGLAAGGMFEEQPAPAPRPTANDPRAVSIPGRPPERDDPQPVGVAGQTINGELAARRSQRKAAARKRAEKRRARAQRSGRSG